MQNHHTLRVIFFSSFNIFCATLSDMLCWKLLGQTHTFGLVSLLLFPNNHMCVLLVEAIQALTSFCLTIVISSVGDRVTQTW